MKRIIVICIVIITCIIMIDFFLQRYVDGVFDKISGKLEEICVNTGNKEVCLKNVRDINGIWEENFGKIACYLEHNELEKVKTQIIVINAGLEVDDFEFVYEETKRAIYILDHIKQKESLKINNIF